MESNRVTLYHKKTGEAVEMWSVDASEALLKGEYSLTKPPAQRDIEFPPPPAPEPQPEPPPPLVQEVEAETLGVTSEASVETESGEPQPRRRRGH